MPRSPQHLHSAARRGSVLIVVLVVCLGLVSITLVFGNAMLLAYRGEDNDLAARQAQNAIEGAARYAQLILTPSTTSTGTTTTTTTTITTTTSSLTSAASALAFGAVPDPLLYHAEAVALGPATFWFIGRPLPTDPVDQPVFSLVDEASKLNINRFRDVTLKLLPGMPEDLATAIFTWRSTISDSASGGGTQLLLDNSPKGAPFESETELALVNGGTDLSILYGNDANLNHCLDPEEGAAAGSVGQWSPGLLEYVTVFSRESNTLPDGTKRVNVTDGGALRGLFTTTFGETRGQQLLAGKLTPQGPPPFNNPLAMYASLSPGMTADEFDKISGKLTTNNNAYTNGLINVNTAGTAVLACVPGLDADKAAQIVAARQARTQPSTGLAWVYPVLQAAGVQAAGRYLTGQSYQFSADIAAVGRHGRGYRRTRFVIDTSTGTPKIVYRRDLTGLGWALGGKVRQNLAGIVDAGSRAQGGLPR